MSRNLPRTHRNLLTCSSALILIGVAGIVFGSAQAWASSSSFDPTEGADFYVASAAVPSLQAPIEKEALSASPAVGLPTVNGYISPLAPLSYPAPRPPKQAAAAPFKQAAPKPMAMPALTTLADGTKVIAVPAPAATTAAPAVLAQATPAATPAPEASKLPSVIAPLPAALVVQAQGPAETAAPAPVAPAPMIVPPAAPAMAGLPDVSPETAARAQAIMAAENAARPLAPQPASVPTVVVQAPPVTPIALPASAPAAVTSATAANGFIAPAPLVVAAPAVAATTPPVAIAQQAAPAVLPDPVKIPMVAAPAPAEIPQLSPQSRSILGRIPSRMDTPPVQKPTKMTLNRVDPQVKAALGHAAKEDSYESVGLSIKVRRPGLDTNYELSQAYTSLMGGDSERAVEIYRNILSVEPKNEDALFGLAATYHRIGRTDEARPVYGRLLNQNPQHREALNNFMALVSEESPQDALPELERLEGRNPDFSPIPAQIAIVLDKMGYAEKAEDSMLRAIELAPDNLTYKYNLAIMLDRHRNYADASTLYRMLIQASMQGEPLPTTTESLQKRLNFIVTAMNQQRMGS